MAELIQRYEAFEQESLAASWTLEEFMRHLHERFPGKDDRLKYLLWNFEKLHEERVAERTSPMSRKEAIQMLDTMNYNERSNRAQITSAMACQIAPWLPVDMYEYGDFYRITLHPYALLPDDPRPPHSRLLVSDNGLGVTINVQSPGINPHVSHLPGKNTVVNESDDSDNGGFIFHQIGILETCSGEGEDLQTLEDAGEADWMRN